LLFYIKKYYYRFSRSRGKADYFEGRDDSGVVSARFIADAGGTQEFRDFYAPPPHAENQALLKQCLALGSSTRPARGTGSLWNDWFGSSGASTEAPDRCRILFNINTVGVGRGSTMLWETAPPLPNAEGPAVWTSEQETAATHLERQLEEINQMCASGLIAARVQIMVCEPISHRWTDWMDSKLTACGGKPWKLHRKLGEEEVTLEERPSPVQIVVAASATTADTCHDLKSGFMEKRQQDLVLAPPYLDENASSLYKATHPDLVSSDHHDLYVATKWSSLVTIRAVHAFLQASTDLTNAAQNSDAVVEGPSSPFLVPSFVRVSYVSEENAKVAKWRMHGDFFHPAAWEICKDSFDVTWIGHSADDAAGQWWVYFTELQMPVSPEVFANEITPAVVQGGSNFVWMVSEQQRLQLVQALTCRHRDSSHADNCPPLPQAVMPLGDLESFLINFTPNTALGKEHIKERRPGYSRGNEREEERKRVKERKQLHEQEEIESALFDYTIYPSALFHKDATLKAARGRDKVLTKNYQHSVGPQTCKSSYYDVTITKPRPAHLGWCQAAARRGLCSLYASFFRSSGECAEACGLQHDWTSVDGTTAES
jgi:hypothetical protein